MDHFNFLLKKGKGRTKQRLNMSSKNRQIAVSVRIASEAGQETLRLEIYCN